MNKDIQKYNNTQKGEDKKICKTLSDEIDKALKKSESKLWHGGPVWFLDGNPIVGYNKRKVGVTLLFWSGQSFKAKGLKKEGSFKAAEKNYVTVDEIVLKDLRAWLRDSKIIQWDYKNIVKRKGKLVKIQV